ncbi:MAG TPA: Gfo/Idh/MocA family oxidoreductase [Bacteroidales bacterium]|nr:Gfo/Idh/MocA family oxidoreductase [Bacteroidales bacterium]
MNSRRNFIKTAAIGTAGLTIGLNTFCSSKGAATFGPNDKIRVGFIGIGNRGSQLLALFMQNPDCEIAAFCDTYKPYMLRDRSKVDPRFLSDRAGQVPTMGEKFSNTPVYYDDYRKLLADKTIDAVVIATPDHWHAIQTIDAIKAGKDVYCEKPLTATISEGRAMVNAQKASNRVVAVGLNRRGNEVYQKLSKEISKIGKISVARAARISNMFPNGIGKLQPEQPPKDFNWDMWLGPRAFRPYQYNIAPYMFRWWGDYSSQMGNWGVHYMDAIRWMMGEVAPVAISAHGGKYVLDHDGDIPDTMQVTFEFASKALISFGIYEASSGEKSFFPYGEIELRGTKGTAYASQDGYRIIPATKGQFQNWNEMITAEDFNVPTQDLTDGSNAYATGTLVRNFLDCIKSRKTPLCPLEEGHRSTSFAHLANIALKVGQRLEWDQVNERFTNSEKANEFLSYEYRKPWKLA